MDLLTHNLAHQTTQELRISTKWRC